MTSGLFFFCALQAQQTARQIDEVRISGHHRCTLMADADGEARRRLLKVLTGGVVSMIGALGALPGVRFLLSPLRAASADSGVPSIRVASRFEVSPNKPLRVTVFGELKDAWMRLERVKLGNAWLVQSPEGRVRAFSAACPHLGCAIDWDEGAQRFDCPCHKSGFAMDGRCLFGPAPRALDELDVDVTDDSVKIRYQRFRPAVKDKEPLG